jgi:hypothetical protein
LDSTPAEIGFAPHTLRATAEDLCHELDPLLLQRKGRLTILATETADRDVLGWICRDYYGSRSFDAIPTLLHSLSQAYRDHPGLAESIFLLVAQRGLDIFFVGNSQALVRLVRYNVVRDLFDPVAPRSGFRVAMAEHPGSGQAPALYSTQWRLVKGDVLLLTVQPAGEHIGDGTLRRALQMASSPDRAARSLKRHRRIPVEAPLMVMRHTPISPIPDIPSPGRQESEPERERPLDRQRSGVSPVLIAGLITLVAVLFTLWRTGTRLDPGDIPEYVQMMFFPAPTPTPDPTLEAGEEIEMPEDIIHEAPQLVTPYDGARVTGAQAVLAWDWGQDLGPSERFEVTVRPPGTEPEARTLTRERRHSINRDAEGWYEWSVRIVTVEITEAPVALSPRAEPATFHWSAD